MDREAWCAGVNGVTKSQTWLIDWTDILIPHIGAFIWYVSYFTYDILKVHSCYDRWQDVIYFWLSRIPLFVCVCVFISHLLYPLICPRAHFGCFYISAILQWIGCIFLSVLLVFLYSSDKYLEVACLDYMIVLFLILWEICFLFSLVVAPAFLSIVYKGLPLSTSSPLLTISYL